MPIIIIHLFWVPPGSVIVITHIYNIISIVSTQLISFSSPQVTKSNTNPDDLGGLANQLTNEFGNLADEAKYAAMTAENQEVMNAAIGQDLQALIQTILKCCLCLSPDWFSHQEASGRTGIQLHRTGDQSWSSAMQPQ